jgi:hypothetical protein
MHERRTLKVCRLSSGNEDLVRVVNLEVRTKVPLRI